MSLNPEQITDSVIQRDLGRLSLERARLEAGVSILSQQVATLKQQLQAAESCLTEKGKKEYANLVGD